MKYSKELHERVRQNLRMFDYPRFDDGDIDCLLDEIERLQAERRWTPVSEPPKKNGYFWCSIVDDAGCKWADKRLFSVENGWFTIGEQVTHWMPLPSIPESEDE